MNKLFTFHKLNNTGIDRAKMLADQFDKLATEIEKVCPESVELNICMRKLEESCFYAKKAMANSKTNQEHVQSSENNALPPDQTLNDSNTPEKDPTLDK